MSEFVDMAEVVADVLRHAGFEDVYTFPPSTLNCACPIVVSAGQATTDEVFADGAYVRYPVDVRVVRENRGDAQEDCRACIRALMDWDYEGYGCSGSVVRAVEIEMLPGRQERDGSGRAVSSVGVQIIASAESR